MGHGDDFAGHGLGQAWGFRVLIIADGLFDLVVDLLLCPIGGGDKSVQACEAEQQTDQTNAARTNLDTDQMQGSNEPMEEGESRATVKKLGHLGTDIERVIP